MINPILASLDATAYPIVAIDAEWYRPKDAKRPTFLTKQFTFLDAKLNPGLTVILWDKKFAEPSKIALERLEKQVGHRVYLVNTDVEQTVLADVVNLPKSLTVLMFYSPKDVEATIGAEAWRELLAPKGGQSPIKKTRNLTGKFEYRGVEYTLKDCFGAFNQSLDAAFDSVGIESIGKKLSKNRDKSKMNEWMIDNPDTFLFYSAGDTVDLGKVVANRIDQVNEIVREALGDDMPEFTFENFPMSSGSLVAKTFENYLMTYHPDLYRAVLLLSDSNDNKSWGELKKLKGDLVKGTTELLKANRVIRGNSKLVHGLGMGSIRNFALLTQNTGVFGAMVQGGRCLNEEPKENPYDQYIENVVDIDLSSCYGTALRQFDFPLGIPTLWERGIDDQTMNLGDWLKEHEDILVDGLYTVVVSGSLPFEQDLIYSKYGLSTRSILRTLYKDEFDTEITSEGWGREVETAHLGGDFVMTRTQIENGILTADNLKVLRAVCSNVEFNAFKALSVVSATYYPKDEEVSPERFTRLVMNEKTRGAKRAKGDSRLRAWTRLPLETFIGSFVNYRKRLKAQMKTAETPEEKNRLNLNQNGVKLFVNTTYGDLAAPYFPMGNTVLANNITAKARTGVWMLSKALLTVQSITDGGMFSNDRVAFIKPGSKLPGMNVLSNRDRLLKHRGVTVGKLSDRDVWAWMKQRTPDDERKLDALATEHINEFWGNYGLTLPFSIECKYENTAKAAVYFASSDYLLYETVANQEKTPEKPAKYWLVKTRGAKEDNHPKKLLLWHILDPQRYPVPQPEFKYTELLGVSDFQKHPDPELLPGDEQELVTYHKPHSQGHYLTDEQAWKRYEDTKARTIRRYNRDSLGDYYGVAKKMSQGAYRLPQRAQVLELAL